METKATLRGVRLSVDKGRLVADLIRGKKVDQALNVLQFTQKKAAVIIKKVLESAIANYELAYRMQVAVPEVMDISREAQHILDLYGAQPGFVSPAESADDPRVLYRGDDGSYRAYRLGNYTNECPSTKHHPDRGGREFGAYTRVLFPRSARRQRQTRRVAGKSAREFSSGIARQSDHRGGLSDDEFL